MDLGRQGVMAVEELFKVLKVLLVLVVILAVIGVIAAFLFKPDLLGFLGG